MKKVMTVVVSPCKINEVEFVAEKYGWDVLRIGCDARLAESLEGVTTRTYIQIQMNDELNAACIKNDVLRKSNENDEGKLLMILSCGIMDISEDPAIWEEFSFTDPDLITRRYDAIIYPTNKVWEKYHSNVIKDRISLMRLFEPDLASHTLL